MEVLLLWPSHQLEKISEKRQLNTDSDHARTQHNEDSPSTHSMSANEQDTSMTDDSHLFFFVKK